METFFDGLDCRLRVSGMVADSIMMGIVNSAMENAYKKSLSKQGDLERLNQKSRFCELAIMQLEWCLKYLQDEINGNVIEGTCEREQLLSDLLKTRDRINHRLEETESAIADKDKELTRRKERESKLKLALEMKGEEVSSLHTALGLEKVRSKRASGFLQHDARSMEKNGHPVFGELTGSLHRQLQRIRGKLEDGLEILTNLMQKKRRNSSDADKLTFDFELGVGGGGMKSLQELYDIAQLKLDLREIVVDVGILTENIEYSFAMMGRSVSLFKAALDEQYWVSDVEKEISKIIIKNSLQETQYGGGNLQFGVPTESSPPVLLDMNWSAFMDDITSLHDELEVLVSQIDMQLKTDGNMDLVTHHKPLSRVSVGGKDNCNSGGSRRDDEYGSSVLQAHEEFSDSSSRVRKSSEIEGLSKESPSGHFVADLIRNHESLIRQKSEEINWLNGEPSREKVCSLRNDKTFDSVKETAFRIISKLNDIRREDAQLVAARDGHRFMAYERDKSILQNNSSRHESENKEIMVTQISREFLDQPRNELFCHLGGTVLCEEIGNLKEEKIDSGTKAGLLEEAHTIHFKGLMKGLHLDFSDYNMETLIREDTYKAIICGMIKEWNNDKESYKIERLLKEEIDCIVFSEVIKDMICVESLTLMKSSKGGMPIGNNLSQASMETMQKVESLSNDFKVEEGLDFNYNLEPVESYRIERLLKEEIDCIVFSEAIKDMICAENLTFMKYPEAEIPFGNNLFYNSMISESMETVQEMELLSNDFKVEEGSDFICNSELMKFYSIERLLREEIDCIVFSEAIKYMICGENLSLMECPEVDMPFGNNLSQNSVISESMETMQEVESPSNDCKVKEDLDFNCNSETVETYIHLDSDRYKIEESNKLNVQHTELLVEKDDVFELVNKKFETHHLFSTMMQINKPIPCLLSLDDKDVAHDLVTSASGMIFNGNHPSCSPTGLTGKHGSELQVILMPLMKFSQVILDFEFMMFDKVKVNMSRLEYLSSQLNPLIEQAVSIKRKELLYHKAFTRRCYDLQTAEAEVDLLGDEVDALLGLIQKIYIALDHYSPVLHHYFGSPRKKESISELLMTYVVKDGQEPKEAFEDLLETVKEVLKEF